MSTTEQARETLLKAYILESIIYRNLLMDAKAETMHVSNNIHFLLATVEVASYQV
jgi:hypothetical protein